MPVATAADISALLDRNYELEKTLAEVVTACDRMFAGRGAKGLEPSPRLQEAFDKARALVPGIPEQQGPRCD